MLGRFAPLLGEWRSDQTGERISGMTCKRRFDKFGTDFVQLDAAWEMGTRGTYREIALFGKDGDSLAFWSFTNDGKRSTGVLVDADDVHPSAIAFIAEMPAGTARMVYWPPDTGPGFNFAVESKVKAGWKRFLLHRYVPASG